MGRPGELGGQPLSGGRSRVSEPKPKSFEISKWAVWEAYRKVKANKGAAGVDGESIEEFDQDLQGNLYRLWNRLSSGSYFPPAVRAVEIPKRDGSPRVLGVPTVADRIAQTVVCGYLEPCLRSKPERRTSRAVEGRAPSPRSIAPPQGRGSSAVACSADASASKSRGDSPDRPGESSRRDEEERSQPALSRVLLRMIGEAS
jgi:hypothetical protein